MTADIYRAWTTTGTWRFFSLMTMRVGLRTLHREAYVRYVAVTRYLLTEPLERLHTRADSW